MSYWAAVAGFIELSIKNTTPYYPEILLTSILGETWHGDSPIEGIQACTVPQGSEGSIQYKLINMNCCSNITNLRNWHVAIWGELRDFENRTAEVQEWLQKIISHKSIDIITYYIELFEQDWDVPVVFTDKTTLPNMKKVIYMK